MLVLVGFSFIFQGFILWRVGRWAVKAFGPRVKALYEKFMTTLDSVPKMEESVSELKETMIMQNQKFQEHLEYSNSKDQAMARDIKELQVAVEQVRYLTTTLQEQKSLNDNKH
jgi:hypothetical protein